MRLAGHTHRRPVPREPGEAFRQGYTLRLLIRRLRDEQGITFLISSHQLSDLEQVCERFLFIGGGRILNECSREDLLGRFGSLEQAFVATIASEGGGGVH